MIASKETKIPRGRFLFWVVSILVFHLSASQESGQRNRNYTDQQENISFDSYNIIFNTTYTNSTKAKQVLKNYCDSYTTLGVTGYKNLVSESMILLGNTYYEITDDMYNISINNGSLQINETILNSTTDTYVKITLHYLNNNITNASESVVFYREYYII